MNILFFVEPLIQVDNPYAQGAWFHLHIEIMVKSMKKLNYKCFFAVNNSLDEIIKDTDYRDEIEKIFYFSQKELKKFSFSSIGILEKWYNESYSEKELEDYKNIMLNKFGETEFDVIITFSPVSYLKNLYPKALILHYEFGVFSRAPFPVTFFLDPVGPGGSGYINKYHNEILENINFTEKEERLLDNFVNKIKKTLMTDNPFKEEIKKLREKFKYIVLLPLQFNNFYLFDLEADYKSQFEYLEDVLIKTSENKDIGIIVTQHPGSRCLSSHNVKYFRDNYQNFIYLGNSESYISVSQIMMPLVDAVITVSTSVGYHALLWNKKLITLGKNYLKAFSDCSSLCELDKMFSSDSDYYEKKKFLYWIIANYVIPENYIKDEKRLEKFLKRSIENKNNMEKFYSPVDNIEKLSEHLIEQTSDNLTKSLINYSNEFILIYVNSGKGYNDGECYRVELKQEIELEISEKYVESILCRFYGIDILDFEKGFVSDKEGNVAELKKIDVGCYYEIQKNIFYINHENYLSFYVNSKTKKIHLRMSGYKNNGIYEILKEYTEQKEQLTKIEHEKNILEGKYKKDRDKINEVILTLEHILSSKTSKMTHFSKRIIHQLLLGSIREKKNFIKWILRNPDELSNHKYNPQMVLLDMLSEKEENDKVEK